MNYLKRNHDNWDLKLQPKIMYIGMSRSSYLHIDFIMAMIMLAVGGHKGNVPPSGYTTVIECSIRVSQSKHKKFAQFLHSVQFIHVKCIITVVSHFPLAFYTSIQCEYSQHVFGSKIVF